MYVCPFRGLCMMGVIYYCMCVTDIMSDMNILTYVPFSYITIYELVHI